VPMPVQFSSITHSPNTGIPDGLSPQRISNPARMAKEGL
jgi:hypothetical protein